MANFVYKYSSGMKFKAVKLNDVDEQNYKVDITISDENNIDSDGDIVEARAFAKTLQENGIEGKNRIKHLMQHNIYKPIGMPVEFIQEDGKTRVISKLANNTAGRDAMEGYKINLYEHSIGFEIINGKPDEQMNAYRITEIKLWEYSSVTWGANENTLLNGFKAKDKVAYFEGLEKQVDLLNYMIRKSDITDEYGYKLEYQTKLINKQIAEAREALANGQSHRGTDNVVEPSYGERKLLADIHNILKN